MTQDDESGRRLRVALLRLLVFSRIRGDVTKLET